jgi:hypothetical protein
LGATPLAEAVRKFLAGERRLDEMGEPEATEDLAAIAAKWGVSYDIDSRQGQSWRILSGGRLPR